jgi:anion-transporting  ArsA/GET3 family ATPase
LQRRGGFANIGRLVARELFQRRFVLITGKGGVGRTTVSTALALAAAHMGLRTCLVQMNSRDDVGPLIGHSAATYQPVRLDPQLPLWGATLTPAEALREYGLMKLKLRALQKLVFENDIMRRLLRMIPGMNELVLLGKVWHMAEAETTGNGRPAWDLLVVDAPATGHGVSLLKLPQVILQAVPVGPMADETRQMRALLADPARTAVHVVTLPQELPATEALELTETVRRELAMSVGYLFVNRVLPDLLREVDPRAAHQALPFAHGVARDALTSVAAWQAWRAAQQAQINRLRKTAGVPVVELPELFEPLGRPQLERLAQWATAGMEAAQLQAGAAQTARVAG